MAQPAGPGAGAAELPPPLELEHVIGYAGATSQSAQAHPTEEDAMVYHVSSLVVLASKSDPHAQRLLRGHTNDVSCLALSADGEYVASGQQCARGERSGEAHVFVWSHAEAKPIYRLVGLRSRALAVSFSRDNRFLCGSDDERRLCVWDLQNGQLVNASRQEAAVGFVAWGPILAHENARGAARPASYTLCVGAGPRVLELDLRFNVRSMQFEIETSAMAMPSNGLKREYNVGVYADGDAQLLAGTRAGELCVYGTARATAAAKDGGGVFRACVPVSAAGAGGVMALAVDGQHVWAGCGDGKVKLLRGADQAWEMLAEAELGAGVVALSLGAGRTALLAGTADGCVHELRAATLQKGGGALYSAHTAAVVDCAFGSSSSESVATASDDGSVRLWDLSTYAPAFSAHRAGRAPTCVHVGADDAPAGLAGLLLSGWADGAIYCHDPAARALLWAIEPAHAGPVTAVCLSDVAILSAGEDARLRAWSLGGRRCEQEYSEHTKGITALVVDVHDASVAHTAGRDQLVVSLNLAKKKRIAYHSIREGQLSALCQRAHGEAELLSGTHEGSIHVWDVDELGPVGLLKEPAAQRLNCLALSPSGRYLAVCTEQLAMLQVWDIGSADPAASARPIAIGEAHSEALTAARWSPDEKQIVSTGKDGIVAVWNWFGQ